MGYVIGANPYSGRLVETVDYQRGKGFKPGTRAMLTDPTTGESKEFVAVKLAAATWLSGVAIYLDGGGDLAVVTTVSANPAPALGSRIGILVFASATATHTTTTTSYGWAQIYGHCKAYVSASVSTPGTALGAGTSGQLVALGTASASAVVFGITYATATGPGGGLAAVLLQYPKLQPFGA